MAAATGLSARDSSVLNAIFGGEHGAIDFSANKPQQPVIINMDMKPDAHVSQDLVEQLVAREKAIISELETAQKDNDNNPSFDNIQLHKMCDEFSAIINEQPKYASAYNNRAQVYRMQLLGCRESGSANTRFDLYDQILEDLQTSVSLALPDGVKASQIIVSKMQANILKSSYSQLAAVYTAMSQDEQYLKSGRISLKQWDLEEKASAAFFSASEFGDEIARAMATRINPYAKLCGNIVQEALARERNGH